ncbi:Solute carrier family 26 member 9 [Dissostichus eleginoides]|uniref:Solute carrier family 26 member 9 n=1 Tax=Dissostichus eleginoides TaxID=100907 RepID=A0AAD9CBT9_DISEL|nr:Solute carrier family 26 member 9 [Dissostichus eleginoides]
MHRPRPRYVIDRPVFNLPDFDQEFDKKSRQFPVGEKVKKLFRCSALRLQALLFRLLPILRWLPKYKPRESLLRDVVSGISAGTIQVPQGMAFALLANLPPVNGLYSSFFPLIPYFFMGTVHQMVPESDFSHFNETLNATVVDTEQMNEVRLGISGTLACLTAVIQIGLGFMQFGFVAIYLSESFIRGFMTAAGLQILISVLKYIFGIKVPPYSGPLAAIYTLVDIFRGLPETNVASLVFALVSSVVLIAVKELNARYRHKLPFPFPMEIIIVVVATAISGPLHLPEKYHMDVVGEIALGFPAPILPKVGQWEEMLGTAFSLAVVGYVINLAMGRTLAAKHGYDVDPNQEMLALGCSNFLGSFFKIHVICCALSVTLAVDSAGGTSQFASLCVMLVVMVTMLSLGAFLKPLPKSVLGALIAVNLKNTLLQLSDPYYLWKKSRLDCCVWVVSFLATFFLSLPYGVAVGVGFSILVVIFKTQFRNGSAVAQIMDTDIYRNPKVYSKVISITGVEIVNYCSPLYFANADMFRQRVIKKTGLDPGKLILARRNSLVAMKSQIISQLEMQDDFDTSSPRISYVNFHSGDANVGEQDPSPSTLEQDPPTLELKPTPFHTLILDLPGVCFMDLTGINTLIKMNSSYTTLGIKLYLANVQAQVYEELEAGGAFDDGNISRSNLFLSVHDAVVFAQQSSAERRVSWEAEKAKQELSSNINEEKDLEQEMFEH